MADGIEAVEVELQKKPNEGGLGFNIRGGKDQPTMEGDNGIFISKVRENGAAAELARQAQKGDRPYLKRGDKLLEIDGHSLVNIDHNEAVNLFVTSGEKVRIKFIPRAQEIIVERRELAAENEARRATMWTISFGLIGVSAVSFLLYKKYGSSLIPEKIRTTFYTLWPR